MTTHERTRRLAAVGKTSTRSTPPETARDFSALPSVDAVLAAADAGALSSWSRAAAASAVRDTVAGLRERIRAGEQLSHEQLDPKQVAADALALVQRRAASRLPRVVNATGVVLHTNLGRAVLAGSAVDAAARAAAGPCALEYDLERGTRGDRDSLVEDHLCALTGAEAATVVNNNAAAVVLALHSLAHGREVVVSRGELIEIGGSFRIPDIMTASGARLCEVGTTNRTHLGDFRRAIGSQTALLLKVHASNYRIVGFTSAVSLRELAALAAEHPGVEVVEDLGAGALLDLTRFGLEPEPVVADSVRAGAGLVLASGDKLLGGPQCGIVVGRRALVDRLRANPLRRALRCDKVTLAALEATLRIYRFGAAPQLEIPTLRYLLRPVEELRRVGEEALGLLGGALGDGWQLELVPSRAEAGSGSWPGVTLESLAIAVRCANAGAVEVERRFRSSAPPILGRIENDTFLLDLRTIDDARDLVPARP